MIRQRERIRFSKTGDLRWIGHRDLVRTLGRSFRRAGLRLSMTAGFHPRPRMSFARALPLGVEGADEIMDLSLALDRSALDLHACLERPAPPGLAIQRIDLLAEDARKPHVRRADYGIPVPAHHQAAVVRRIADMIATPGYDIQRGEGQTPLKLSAQLVRLEFVHGVLNIGLKVHQEGSLRARDVLRATGLGDIEQEGLRLTRTRIELDI